MSFLLLPFAPKHYNFWLYICPLDAGFSTRAAVTNLRKAVTNNIVPWGTIVVNDLPLLDQVINAACKTEFPSDVHRILASIRQTNEKANYKLERMKQRSAIGVYSAES